MTTPVHYYGTLRKKAITPIVSVIVPVYNEAENIGPLLRELFAVCESLNMTFELIFVDDGSTDNTIQILRNYVGEFAGILKVVELCRNYGQTSALSAGFSHAKGEILITLDGDLQNDPQDIPLLIKQLLDTNSDLVVGWRKNRQDDFITRILPSKVANWIIAQTTGLKFHDYGCSLKAYRKHLAQDLPLYGELHRFIPFLAAMEGAKITEVPVNHRPRRLGKSKYNLSRTIKVLLDLGMLIFLRRFFTRPLHLFGRAGLAMAGSGFLILAWLGYQKLVLYAHIGTRPLLMLGVLLFLVGVQLLSTGLLAELQIRTYFESQKKPPYKVRTVYH